MLDDYMCTVLLITYKHSKTVARALDSILEQKSRYNYKIHAFDDGSDDGTQDVIRQYAQKYPNIIYPFFAEKNQAEHQNQWNQQPGQRIAVQSQPPKKNRSPKTFQMAV